MKTYKIKEDKAFPAKIRKGGVIGLISRHTPTKEQIALCKKWGFNIHHLEDLEAWSPNLKEDVEKATKDVNYVCSMHTNIINQLHILNKTVVTFKNENRAPQGQRPDFYTSLMRFSTLEGHWDGMGNLLGCQLDLKA